jgi:hypothetical protein
LNGAYSNFLVTIGLDGGAPSGSSVVFKVLADNTTIYTSPTMSGSSGWQQLNLNVAKVGVLDLVVTAVGGNAATDYADWCNAQLTPAGVTLATSLPGSAQGGMWGVGRNTNFLGGPIMLNNVAYQQGIGEFTGTVYVIALNGNYSTFKATIGVDSLIGQQGSVSFYVVADGRGIYQSSVMTASSPAQSISLNVKYVKSLTLRIIQGNSQVATGDYADWALAELFP